MKVKQCGLMLMGTNYYRIQVKYKQCPECKKAFYWATKGRHIGKTSWGWKFHFRAGLFINPYEWKDELLRDKWYIVDEYGEHMTRKHFIKMVDRLQERIEPELSFSEKEFMEQFPRHKPININGYLFYQWSWS